MDRRCAGLHRRIFSGALNETGTREQGTELLQPMKRISPCGFKSGSRKVCGSPMLLQTASATRCPDRAALSIVEGQPVRVQSPARKQLGQGAAAVGREASIPGGTPKVACISFTSAAFSNFAEDTAGKNSASSATACAMACSRDSVAKARDALTTSSR